MTRSLTRRGLLGALLAGGTGAGMLSPADGIIEAVAPVSGGVYQSPRQTGIETVETPHGPATVTYDDHHVPYISAESEPAAYFAVGYAQAADRLFQMDMFRRRGGGRLAEVVGNVAGGLFVERDIRRTKLGYGRAATASQEAIGGSPAERMLEAYADGVNRYIERGPPGVEFELLDYEPEPWTVTDSLRVGMSMNEQQTFGFPALRQQVLRQTFDEDTYRKLHPRHLDHGASVIRDDDDSARTTHAVSGDGGSTDREIDPTVVEWLDTLGGPDLFGSNAWVVSGEHTGTGDPIVCNDPHLPLTAPPIFYQQHIATDGHDVRGVTFPGVPFVFVGENDHGAWGMTSAPVDLLDTYTYEIDGDQYRYRDEWREFETEIKTIPVRNGEDREVEVRTTVHGPLLEPEINGQSCRIGLSWVPLSGTRTVEALYEWNHASGVEEFRTATRKFDTPPLHVHYADTSGNTFYQLAAKVPIRRSDGQIVPGDRVFDGSTGEGEWDGFDPYGQSSWEGFVPFEELPSTVNPEYAASANQRPVADPDYPFMREDRYGFRAKRIYERLDRAAEEGITMDRDFMKSLQLDTLDIRARHLVPAIVDARDRMSTQVQPWIDLLADWDYGMDRDSKAALVFEQFMQYFSEETWQDVFDPHDLSSGYWPAEWVLVTLPPDSEFFDGDRAAVLATAMERAVENIETEDWDVYGESNQATFDHPLGGFVSGLNYPSTGVDGSDATVNAFYGRSGVSYRFISEPNGPAVDVLPGGNHGSVYSDHYHDQLTMWAEGKYTPLGSSPGTTVDIRFKEGDG